MKERVAGMLDECFDFDQTANARDAGFCCAECIKHKKAHELN